MNVYNEILRKKKEGTKQFAILLDPDKVDPGDIDLLCKTAVNAEVDYIFVGGSLLTNNSAASCIRRIKYACSIPVIIFPGSTYQIDEQADALLFLSLISGRNPELLIGQHVISAPLIREKKIEAISTGYILVESGRTTTALYMSNTFPVPAGKPDIAACTAMAGEMLGMKVIFLDAGSGAEIPVSAKMIQVVRENISVPLIVGGGIRNPEKAIESCKAGADLIVVGNSIENNPSVISEIAEAVKSVSV